MDAETLQPPQALPKSCLSTDALPEGERFDVWRESVMPLFETIHDESACAEPFRARVEGFHLQNMLLGTSSFSAQRFRRSRAHAGQTADHFLVQMYLDGGYLGHNGGCEVDVELGDISLLDLGYPLETCAPMSTNLTLVLPRELFYAHVKSSSPAPGTVISASSPLGKIVGNHLLSVWQALPSATIADTAAITQVLLGVVAGAFNTGAAADEPGAHMMERATLEAIRRYIDQNLASPTLSPARLCGHFGCSRAQLYRLFQPLGGISTYVREARLKRCMDELTTSGPGRKRVAEISSRWGFSNQSHFCRLFREVFGITPGEAFEKARTSGVRNSTAFDKSGGLPLLRDWLVTL